MSENAREHLEQIGKQISALPHNVADEAVSQFAAKMEGFAEGFAAGQAHAQNKSA